MIYNIYIFLVPWRCSNNQLCWSLQTHFVLSPRSNGSCAMFDFDDLEDTAQHPRQIEKRCWSLPDPGKMFFSSNILTTYNIHTLRTFIKSYICIEIDDANICGGHGRATCLGICEALPRINLEGKDHSCLRESFLLFINLHRSCSLGI